MKAALLYSTVFILASLTSALIITKEESNMFIQFQDFAKTYNKTYETPEIFMMRFRIFQANLNWIYQENQKDNTHELGVNQFSDLTFEEFKERFMMKPSYSHNGYQIRQAFTFNQLPEAIDWDQKGAIPKVKNQGQCGSCDQFSALDTLTCSYWKKYGQLVEFSLQQLIDCDSSSQGCTGGWQGSAFKYWQQNCAEVDKDYPATMKQEKCQFDKTKCTTKVDAIVQVLPNELALKEALAQSAVQVAVDASNWMMYQGGILSNCKNTGLNHVVTLVGYGEENGVKFWRLKNSWGTSWGERGFVRLLRTEKETEIGSCGLAQSALQITVS